MSSDEQQQQHDDDEGGLFFADAQLDLQEAHDIAETPEPTQRSIVARDATVVRSIRLPELRDHNHNAGNEGNTSTGDMTENQQTNGNGSAGGSCSNGSSSLDGQQMSNGKNSSNLEPKNNRPMSRITSLETALSSSSRHNSSNTHHRRPRNIPGWPRDAHWGLAYLVGVPCGLLWPLITSFMTRSIDDTNTHHNHHALASRPLNTHSFQSIIWASVAAVLVCRQLFASRRSILGSTTTGSTNGGGSGVEYNSHHHITQWAVAAPPLAVGISALLTLTQAWTCRDVWYTAMVPLVWTCQDYVHLRRVRQGRQGSVGGVPPAGHNRIDHANGANNAPNTNTNLSSPYAFFQALVSTALDITGRALRRVAVWRFCLLTLTLQIMTVAVWRWALLKSLNNYSAKTGGILQVYLALGAGYWATSVIRRVVTLVISGGVLCWLMEYEIDDHDAEAQNGSVNTTGYSDTGNGTSNNNNNSMPEAYRSVDARVYSTVRLAHDDDDDFYGSDDFFADAEDIDLDNDLNDNEWESPTQRTISTTAPNNSSSTPPLTVRRLARVAMTVSFGSVALCGLVGGTAQFIWSQLHKIQIHWTSQYRGMTIGGGDANSNGNATSQSRLESTLAVAQRTGWYFVRHYNDLGMSHVAAYHKAYSKASRDVLTLAETAQIQGVWQSDVTSHLLSSMAGGVASLIVLVTNGMALHQLNHGVSGGVTVTDWNVVQNMMLSWVLSYTLLLTVLEPIRASVKAVYVAYCQNPTSLSQAFPLIYHRLRRLSSESANMA